MPKIRARKISVGKIMDRHKTNTRDGDLHSITGPGLSATIKADGAELCSLRGAGGQEVLWQAGPGWPRHAPNLFPIVGTLKDNRLVHRGVSYPMGRHGFARDLRFAWQQRDAECCSLVAAGQRQDPRGLSRSRSASR